MITLIRKWLFFDQVYKSRIIENFTYPYPALRKRPTPPSNIF